MVTETLSNIKTVEDKHDKKPGKFLIFGLLVLALSIAVLLFQVYKTYFQPYLGAYGDASMDYLLKENPKSLSGGDLTHFHSGGLAYEQEAPNLPWGISAAFDRGDGVFERPFRASIEGIDSWNADGLGPHFNHNSCEACHQGDGRAKPPSGIDEKMNGVFLRISIPGPGIHGQPMATHPGFGYQIADRGINGVPAEADTRISWVEKTGRFPDGTEYSLRKPRYHISNHANVELDPNAVIEARIANPVFGLGLLEAIPEATILEWADENDENGDGISGKPNYAWNPEKGEEELGRFGWKANNSTIRMQSADAAFNDVGITNPMFRELTSDRYPDFLAYQNCRPEQVECLESYDSGELEMTEAQLQDMVSYLQFLAVPYRRSVEDPVALKGEKLFADAGCVACHKTHITTGGHKQARLNGQLIHPYTDLLLHDMGPGLSGRPDFKAEKQEWRTAPLWGIGLTETVNGHTNFLHDGRARNLEEAILWHGGEAEKAKQNYMNLEKVNRESILTFLNTL